MNAEEAPRTLADQAADWVPPWAREPEGFRTEPANPDRPIEPAAPGPVKAVPVEPAADEPETAEPETVEPETGPEAVQLDEPERQPDAPAEAEPGSARTPEQAEPIDLQGPLEAILLVVDEPVSEVVLAQVLEQPTERVIAALTDLAAEYAGGARGFELRRAAGGWRLYTRGDYASYVERFVLDGQQIRLTQAALETLAVVAYKQPVTRSRISAIRGVNCDGVIRTLVSRGLVEECGSEPDSGAFLFRTTPLFLEKLGLDSLEQLPPLAPFLPDDVDEIADAQR